MTTLKGDQFEVMCDLCKKTKFLSKEFVQSDKPEDQERFKELIAGWGVVSVGSRKRKQSKPDRRLLLCPECLKQAQSKNYEEAKING